MCSGHSFAYSLILLFLSISRWDFYCRRKSSGSFGQGDYSIGFSHAESLAHSRTSGKYQGNFMSDLQRNADLQTGLLLVAGTTFDNLVQFWEKTGKNSSCADIHQPWQQALCIFGPKKTTHLNNNGINFDINTNITKAQEIHLNSPSSAEDNIKALTCSLETRNFHLWLPSSC